MNKTAYFKVFGDTQEERDRVLAYLGADVPELDMDYIERTGKRFPNHKPCDREFTLSDESMDKAFRFIEHFLNKEP